MYKISIEYCAAWNYLPRALSLEGAFKKEHQESISEIDLIPSGGGAFEIKVNGDLIYSKLDNGRHADPSEILNLFAALIKE